MKNKLKNLELRLTELSEYLNISRPTLYKYVELYEENNFESINPKVKQLFDYIENTDNITKINVISYIFNNLNGSSSDYFNRLRKKNPPKKLQELFILIADNQQYYRIYDALTEFLKNDHTVGNVGKDSSYFILLLNSLETDRPLTDEEKNIIKEYLQGV